MADLVMGAMGNLIGKLHDLLDTEYKLQTGVKDRIRSLTQELEGAQAMLGKVAEVPWDQLDKQVQLWAREVREASYNMEDVLDTFLVRVQGPLDSTDDLEESTLLKRLSEKMTNLWPKSKARREISVGVDDIMSHLQDVTDRFRKYRVDDIIVSSKPATASTFDPRLHAMYNKVKDLVGIDESSSQLKSMLQLPRRNEVAPNPKMKIVSVVGVGGLGKTTLAKAVYDELRGDFDCGAFVPVGRNPDLKKVFKDVLLDLDRNKFLEFCNAMLDEKQLIDELRSFLKNKRYFVVIDDIWEIQSWKTIKLFIDHENNCGGRIIITSRNLEVATIADEVYKLQPLPYDSSRELLFTRIAAPEARYDDNNQPDEISDKFISRCGGIPLAIITMASLLAGKQKKDWSKLYETIGFGDKDNIQAKDTMRIVSFSYYDLPAHLRTCLLYLSAFPEDSVIHKDSLVWIWVAEGFVHEKEEMKLFEIGEGYFNDLVNRSMIQAVESEDHDNMIIGCRVHDLVLDFIRSMSQEENFFTVLDNDQGTALQKNVRRLANHRRTIGHTHQPNYFEMPMQLRSFISLECVIETWAPVSTFKHLRVLAIEKCRPMGDYRVRVKHIGHLLHLRFLSLRETWIDRIPEEIGDLKFLQTLDLWEAHVSAFPPWSSLPKQLACLRISFDEDALDGEVFSVRRLTSLEELSIDVWGCKTERWVLKELGSLSELRVLNARVSCSEVTGNEESKRDLVETLEDLRHLDKLQSLRIDLGGDLRLQATEFVLPRHLRHLNLYWIEFCKLPSCINSLCLPNLSHLNLKLHGANEWDLKILGGLPELCFLSLNLTSSSATIRNISDSDTCYFPKLRCCILYNLVPLFVCNKEDKSVSFHLWNEIHNELKSCILYNLVPFVSDDELKSDDELNVTMPSVSDFDELHGPLQRSKLLHGLAAVAYYLLDSFLHVVAFVRRWSLTKVGKYYPSSISNPGEDRAAVPAVSNDDICSKGASAAAPRFMPSLQVLHFEKESLAIKDFGWEHLSSLREIKVLFNYIFMDDETLEKLKAALRRAAQVHPNRPILRFNR